MANNNDRPMLEKTKKVLKEQKKDKMPVWPPTCDPIPGMKTAEVLDALKDDVKDALKKARKK